jgi:hypothetical protein
MASVDQTEAAKIAVTDAFPGTSKEETRGGYSSQHPLSKYG